jgi:hypothetical protein
MPLEHARHVDMLSTRQMAYSSVWIISTVHLPNVQPAINSA